jgi:formate-dependent nitrite reductase membrane component NrfD
MVKEEFNYSELLKPKDTNFESLMIANWVFFILASISALIIIISLYKNIEINHNIATVVLVIGFISYIISLVLSIVGLARQHTYLSSAAIEQKKKYQPHFISLLILTIISAFLFVYFNNRFK